MPRSKQTAVFWGWAGFPDFASCSRWRNVDVDAFKDAESTYTSMKTVRDACCGKALSSAESRRIDGDSSDPGYCMWRAREQCLSQGHSAAGSPCTCRCHTQSWCHTSPNFASLINCNSKKVRQRSQRAVVRRSRTGTFNISREFHNTEIYLNVQNTGFLHNLMASIGYLCLVTHITEETECSWQ